MKENEQQYKVGSAHCNQKKEGEKVQIVLSIFKLKKGTIWCQAIKCMIF